MPLAVRLAPIAPAIVWLSVAAIAHAQSEPTQPAPASETGTSRPGRGEAPRVARAQQIAGVVRRVDMPRGRIALGTAEGEVLLRAMPDRIDELSPGDRFEGSFALYGEQPWLTEDRNPGTELGALGPTRSINGFVQSWDPAQGRLALSTPEGTRGFHVHPEEQEALIPGRQVSLLYVSVRGEEWVVSVRDRQLPTPRP